MRLWCSFVMPAAGAEAWAQPQAAATSAGGVLTALVRHGRLFASLRRLLLAGMAAAVDAAGDTQMADAPAGNSAQPSPLDTLVSTLTVRAVSSSSGVHPRLQGGQLPLLSEPQA